VDPLLALSRLLAGWVTEVGWLSPAAADAATAIRGTANAVLPQPSVPDQAVLLPHMDAGCC
jgi:hypothetical protein